MRPRAFSRGWRPSSGSSNRDFIGESERLREAERAREARLARLRNWALALVSTLLVVAVIQAVRVGHLKGKAERKADEAEGARKNAVEAERTAKANLELAKRREAKAWEERALYHEDRENHFAAVMMAARGLGFRTAGVEHYLEGAGTKAMENFEMLIDSNDSIFRGAGGNPEAEQRGDHAGVAERGAARQQDHEHGLQFGGTLPGGGQRAGAGGPVGPGDG